MKHNSTGENDVQHPFTENFDYNRAKILLTDISNQSFSEKFRQWLNVYTKPSREKIWVDIEYYKSL